MIVVDIETKERRTVEYKASLWTPGFSGYHVPQVMWEIKCTQTTKGDLVKYCDCKKRGILSCRVTTIDFDNDLYNDILALVVASKKVKNSKEYLKLVHSRPYVDMRERLNTMAANFEYKEIPVVKKFKRFK